jgi:ATP-binding cassette subfamily B protein
MIADDIKNLAWDQLPLSLLTPEQQVKFKHQAETRRYGLGEIIWDTDSPSGENGSNSKGQFLIVSGKVRLVSQGDSVILQKGDWLGDLLELSGAWKARASSKDVIILRWEFRALEYSFLARH